MELAAIALRHHSHLRVSACTVCGTSTIQLERRGITYVYCRVCVVRQDGLGACGGNTQVVFLTGATASLHPVPSLIECGRQQGAEE